MKKLKKLAAAAVSVTLSATMFGCTPSIGSGTKSALTVDGYDVPAGLFIYYTLQGYSEASSELANGSETPDANTVKTSKIKDTDSTDWIQNKATDYCVDFVAIMHEFDSIGESLSADDLDQAVQMADYYYNSDARLEQNGVSLDTMKLLSENSYKEQAVFDHYYGFEGEKGCSEEELKDYFDDNFARVKYISISLLDEEGNKVSDDEARTLRKKAEEYAKQINSKSKELDKMLEVDTAQQDYDDYKASQTTTASDDASTGEETTTTAVTTEAESTESTTTTTTDPYANESLIQKNTTTTKSEDEEKDTTTTAADTEEEDITQSDDYKFKEFLFNDIKKDTATVYDYNDDTIYVVIRGDLRERMTEDDYWSEDYISNLQSMRYYDEFVDYLDKKADTLEVTKNKSAYRRYDPFKLKLEAE